MTEPTVFFQVGDKTLWKCHTSVIPPMGAIIDYDIRLLDAIIARAEQAGNPITPEAIADMRALSGPRRWRVLSVQHRFLPRPYDEEQGSMIQHVFVAMHEIGTKYP